MYSSRLPITGILSAKFVQSVLTDSRDLAFLVGVNNSVLLVQDFTNDLALTSRALNQLAPGGGTSLWDAVGFAAEKLAGHPESQPVARVVVVISDGADNSSSISLRQPLTLLSRGKLLFIR